MRGCGNAGSDLIFTFSYSHIFHYLYKSVLLGKIEEPYPVW